MSFTFHDLTLRQAEETIMAGCLDHEHALVESMRLPWRFFRSEVGSDLERVYYVLRIWYAQNTYDEEEARLKLAALFGARGELDMASWVAYDQLYDAHTVIPGYCVDLVDALLATYAAQDAAVAAAFALNDTPISLAPVPPPSPARRRAPQKGGGLGGVA